MDSEPMPIIVAAPVAQLDPESGPIVGGEPYYKARPNIAPINAKYVIWEKMKSGRFPTDEGADDAAEGRGVEKAAQSDTRRSRNDEHAAAAPEPTVEAVASTSTSTSHPPPSPDVTERDAKRPKMDEVGATVAAVEVPIVLGEDGEPIKKVKLSGAQKKHARRAAESIAWNLRKDEIERVKAANKAAGITAPKQKDRGQNKGRRFDRRAGESDIKLCVAVARGQICDKVAPNACRFSHDVLGYLAAQEADIPIALPSSPDDLETTTSTDRICPLFLELGECPQGYKCRFGKSHMRKVGAGEGDAGSDWVLVVDKEKVARLALVKGEGLSEIREKGEMNVITLPRIKEIRGQGVAKELRFPLAAAYLTSIGEALDGREFAAPGEKQPRGNRAKKNTPAEKPAANVYVVNESDDEMLPPLPAVIEPVASTSAEILPASIDIDSDPSRTFVPDLARVRAGEKNTLDFRGKLYLAPLTTVGNLPFRRLCGTLGNDISCSEMGLAQEFLAGNSSEWSLVRRHPSEKLFGVQICGSRPQALVPAAEAIVKSCDIDFLDVNCGCPIDLVFNKGGGSALLAHAGKLGKSLAGMSKVLGEIPLTIKIRNGISNSSPVAHKLVTRMQTEWGVSAVTLHGRSRQQRYKTRADYAYIAQVARSLRDTASDAGLKPIPIFGNGDAYDYRTYYENMEASGVDGIMIARGALVKPWIFTEIKEKRDWDISSRERLDLIGQLAQFGIEHWGSDTVGLNTARRFLCEAISFQHRYVPVGLLDHLPANLNDRAFPYRGRDELETLLASDQSSDWVKITSMFLGPPPEDWSFLPKHKANASESTEVQG